MLSDTLPATFAPSHDSMLSSDDAGSGGGGFALSAMARIRFALPVGRTTPVTPPEWAELRASLAASRPPPPPAKFRQASSFFRP